MKSPPAGCPSEIPLLLPGLNGFVVYPFDHQQLTAESSTYIDRYNLYLKKNARVAEIGTVISL